MFVDTTAIAPGFVGTVDITATGTLSIDGGASSIPIDFTNDQAVTDSVTGVVTHVDTTNVRLTGSNRVEYDQTLDAFEVLELLERDLRNSDNLAEHDLQDSIQRRLGDLDRIINQLLEATGEQSTTLANLDSLQARSEDLKLNLQARSAEIASTDYTEAIIELQQSQSMLEYTYAASARLLSVSLLDFLR